MIEYRKYQREGVDGIFSAFDDGVQRPALIAPTGAGKTVMMSMAVDRFRRENPGARVVIIAHRAELIEQTINKINSIVPDASTGVVKARRDETGADIVVCSAQTLTAKGRVERLRDVGLVVVDECHHYAARKWLGVLKRLGTFDASGPRAIGFTATMSRGDGAGLGAVWESVIEPTNIIRLIMEGYLCDVKAKAVEVGGLDLGSVARKAGGDFADGSLADALEAAGVADAIAKAYKEHATRDDGTIRPGVVFTPTVAFAHSCAKALSEGGITSEVISGGTSDEDRASIYKRYREGETHVLSNCMVLTEGWDAPWAEVAVIARPTRAQGLTRKWWAAS